MAEEIIEAAEEIEAELFPPKPGGLVDRHRQRKAREKAQQDATENEGNPVEERAVRAVKVAAVGPENVRAMTYSIAAGQSAMVLPLNEYRYRAVVMTVPPASGTAVVILAQDQGQALGGNGFTLPQSVPLEARTRGQLWALNPTDAVVQVSVLSEIYAPEGTVPR